MKVILGGGLQDFLPSTPPADDEEKIDNLAPEKMVGIRKDGRNLIREYLKTVESSRFVSTRDQLLKVDPQSDGPLVGLFAGQELKLTLDIDPTADANTEPTLEEMTKAAVQVLSHSPNGE